MVTTCGENIMLRKILVSEKELSDINFKRFEKSLVYMQNNLIASDTNMYLTVDLLIERSKIITSSNNVTLSKFNVKLYGYNKMYMDDDLIEDKLYQLIYQFNESNINHRSFYFASLGNIHQFYDENGATGNIFYLHLGDL